MTDFCKQFLAEVQQIVAGLDTEQIQRCVNIIAQTRANGGRLFILGVGGSAANASHAVNDFRKIVGLESYAPTDNISELTARINDDGWPGVFAAWLRVSRLRSNDCVLVLSVGGGNLEKGVSPNLVEALRYAKIAGAKITAIIGRDDGYSAHVADAFVLIPIVNSAHITPHSEAFQAIVWHMIVFHPMLKQTETKWESL